MLARVFSPEEMARVIRAGDPHRFGVDLKNDRKALLTLAAERANKHLVDLSKFNSFRLGGKPCVSYDDFESHLILRLVSRYVQRRLRVALPNRDAIVRGVIETLLDATPMRVLRRDLTSFYETIPTEPLKRRLLFDTAIPGTARHYLDSYFSTHCKTESGLPRGVGLSALLAELAMQNFDSAITRLPGVFRGCPAHC